MSTYREEDLPGKPAATHFSRGGAAGSLGELATPVWKKKPDSLDVVACEDGSYGTHNQNPRKSIAAPCGGSLPAGDCRSAVSTPSR